ncbi:hypothetical protein [Pedobacter sp. SYP-B3415]|nr:hypothetical protein [Pedobacter sp. SYP-B3415]
MMILTALTNPEAVLSAYQVNALSRGAETRKVLLSPGIITSLPIVKF